MASRTPGVPVTAASKVSYLPSAVAKSMIDRAAQLLTVAAKSRERVARNFMMIYICVEDAKLQ
jgi:hypothetical protein